MRTAVSSWSAPLRLLAVLSLLGSGIAFGHAEFIESEPAANTTIADVPQTVVLSFTEPIETRFSVFKVYRLDAEVDMSADNAWQRLNGLAGALVSEVLTARDDDDAEARVDSGLGDTEARTAEIMIGLEADLAAGAYVVMWRVLSIDTHTTQGFAVFNYDPAAE